MAQRRNLDRVRRPLGSQPVIHDTATIDALGAMIVALLGEVAVLRDRLDANERLSALRGHDGPDDVDAYLPDAAVAAQRARYRDAGYDRVLGVARDRLMPDQLRDQQRRYDEVIADVSRHEDRRR